MASTFRLVDGVEELIIGYPFPNAGDAIAMTTNEFVSGVPRATVQPRSGRSGTRDTTRFWDAASFHAEIRIYGDTINSRYTYLDRLKKMLAPGKRPYLYVMRDGWTAERRATLRGDSQACVVGSASAGFLEVNIQATIPEGVMEEADPITITIHPGTPRIGVHAPVSAPVSATPGGSPNEYEIPLACTAPSSPLFRVYGGCTDPQFFLTRPDSSTAVMSLSGVVVSPGHYLDIDVLNRAIYMDSSTESSFYSKVDWTVSEWWDLESGSNQITFNADNPDVACFAQIIFRPQWIP